MPAGRRSLRRSVLLSWIASYVLILLIPNVFSVLVYLQSGRVIEEEINRSNMALLKQVEQAMDSQLRELERLSMQIALNSRVAAMAQASGRLSPEQKYAMAEILSEFKLYLTMNGFIDGFYVYFAGLRSVLTTSTFFDDAPLFFREQHESSRLTYPQWLALMEAPQVGEYAALTRKTTAGNEAATIAFLRSIPLTDMRQTSAKLVMLFDVSRFQEAIAAVQGTDRGTVLIVDEEGRLIASTRPFDDARAGQLSRQLTEAGGIAVTELGGEPVALSYVSSNIAQWKYVSIVPTAVFLEKAKYVRNLTAFSLLVCTLIGVAAAIFFARRNYNPVRELLRLLAGTTSAAASQGDDEYAYIKAAIYSTLDERDRIHRKLERQNALLRSNFLIRLMKGRLEHGFPIEEALSAHKLHFDAERYAVVLCFIEDYAFLFRDAPEEDEEKKLRFVHLIIQNIMEELIGERYRCYSAEADGLIACLVGLEPDGDGGQAAALTEPVKRAQSFIREKFHIDFTVAISGAHPDSGGIAEAYQEALEALEYSRVFGGDGLIAYEQVKKPETERAYYYPLDKERQLINCLLIGDADKARQAIDDMLDANLEARRMPVEAAKCLLFELIGTMLKAADELNTGGQEASARALQLVPRVAQNATATELKREITSIAELICAQAAGRREGRGSGLKDEALACIGQQYADVNLSVASLAETLGVSAGHLSRTFKEQTGESVLEAINRIRLEKARELLKETGLSILETAEKVGYSNSNALIRAFKKHEGITPGQYKSKL